MEAWAAPEDAATPIVLIPASSRTERQPYGVTLVIGPSNYTKHIAKLSSIALEDPSTKIRKRADGLVELVGHKQAVVTQLTEKQLSAAQFSDSAGLSQLEENRKNWLYKWQQLIKLVPPDNLPGFTHVKADGAQWPPK